MAPENGTKNAEYDEDDQITFSLIFVGAFFFVLHSLFPMFIVHLFSLNFIAKSLRCEAPMKEDSVLTNTRKKCV